jgi:hypothetical protein
MLARGRPALTAVLITTVLVLSACATEREPVTSPTTGAPVDPLEQSRLDPADIPDFVEGGTAQENLPYFVFRLGVLVQQEPQPSSRQLVDSLVESGFEKSVMEVTADTTPFGSRSDSVLVAVRVDGDCLLGQVSDSGVATDVAEVLSTGRCLVGRTLSIDW